MSSARIVTALCALVAAVGIVAGNAGVAAAEMTDPPACEQDPNGGCLGGPIGMNGNSGIYNSPDPDQPPIYIDLEGADVYAGPNWDNAEAYRDVEFVEVGIAEVPDGAQNVDAFGNRYSSDQGTAINLAVDDAAARGAFANYREATWVPYNPTFGSYRDWFSAVLDWYPSCIDYNGAKATGGLLIPDGALCFSRPR